MQTKINETILTQQTENSSCGLDEIEDIVITQVLGPQQSDRVRLAGVGAATQHSRRFQHDSTPRVAMLQDEIATLKVFTVNIFMFHSSYINVEI